MTDLEQATRTSLRDFMEDWYDRWAGPDEHWTLEDMADAIVESWLADHLLSDESVELVAEAINPEAFEYPAKPETYREMLQATARAKARAALKAVLGTNHNEQEQQ